MISYEQVALLQKDILDYDESIQSGEWVDRECYFKGFGNETECPYCKRAQKIFNYILIGLVLAGTCPPRPFLASRSSNTCPICQTVCCCPDVCAAKIKAKAACGNLSSSGRPA
jgi:hypothetical protein